MAYDHLDLITLGRISVDLYGQQVGGRLEDMSSFAKYLGGCPANVAVGTSKLGLKSGLLSRVGADHMGRFLLEELARNDVDLRGVRIDPDRLTALVILGIRDQNTFPLIFYREDCADMALDETDIDPDYIAAARALLITGTHLSTPSTHAVSKRAISYAKAADRRVILDIDYRPVLWGLTSKQAGENRFVADPSVTRRLQSIAADCDLIVGTEEEFHILGGTTDTELAVSNIRHLSSAELVLKLGPEGCVVFPGGVSDTLTSGIHGPGFEVDVFNVLGAGDGFLSGYLSGWLRDLPTPDCCELGNACGAIVVSRHGCAPAMPSQKELEIFLSRSAGHREALNAGLLDHTHWVGDRPPVSEVYAFAIDHRPQFSELAKRLGKGAREIKLAKSLAYQAFKKVAGDDPRFGMLLDETFARDLLHEISGTNHWIGRPIERPNSYPVRFEGSVNVASEILTWPKNQVVKCLIQVHPDDPQDVQKEQERQVLMLFDACRKTGHEFLLEVLSPSDQPPDPHAIASVLARFYEIGVFPDWWKLEAVASHEGWTEITQIIDQNDKFCRGILVLGRAMPCGDIIASFDIAASFPLVRGFAVGRSIFEAPLGDWMRDATSDQAAIDRMAQSFSGLVDAWQNARTRARAQVSSESVAL